MAEQKRRKQSILIDGKNFILTASNQYNACNQILQLMV